MYSLYAIKLKNLEEMRRDGHFAINLVDAGAVKIDNQSRSPTAKEPSVNTNMDKVYVKMPRSRSPNAVKRSWLETDREMRDSFVH